MKVSFSSMALYDRSVEEVAEVCAEWGFDGIELMCREGAHLSPDTGERRAKEIAKIFLSRGVCVSAIAGYIKFNGELKMELMRNLEDLNYQIRLADAMGAESVRCLGGCVGEGRWRREGEEIIARLGRYLAQAADATRPSKVRILQVTHNEFSTGDVLRKVIDAADRPRVGAAWNLVHSLSAGEAPETTWGMIGDRVGNIHMRDAVLMSPACQSGGVPVPFGEGDVPWDRVFTILHESKYDGWASIEWPIHMKPELSPPEGVLRKGLSFIREKTSQDRECKT